MVPDWMGRASPLVTARDSVAHLVRFRTTVALDTAPTTGIPISIAADSRYRLFVNGELVAVGPMKPSGATWFRDTVDVGGHLARGTNVIGIEVLAFPEGAIGNVSVLRGPGAALAVTGAVAGTDLAEPGVWRCSPAAGRDFLQGVNTLFLGIQEVVEADAEPHGWLDEVFDDAGWEPPILLGDHAARPNAVHPRPLPQMSLEPITFTGVSRTRGSDPGWGALLSGRSVTVAPHQQVDVDLEVDALTTAFIDLEVSGGRGATIGLMAAECYEREPIEVPWLRDKGDRSDAEFGDLFGDVDTYAVSGHGTAGAPERYSPFWFRTVRYLRVSVATGAEPLTLSRLSLTQTRYPLAVTGSFRSSSELDTHLWETSVRTLRNCMHETFEDCPFYEQLQYAMDTRSQALFSLHLSSDDRLVRRAIADFAASGDPSGLTESRSPSVQPQIIPGFSLFWIFMLAEHLDHVGDLDFTRGFLARADAVLSFFDRALSDDGFVLSPADLGSRNAHVDLWNFVDWTDAWTATRGVPDLGERGANTILTFQYVVALQAAARTAAVCGDATLAEAYRSRGDDVLRRLSTSAVRDRDSGYFRDSDTGPAASQHAQVWAVLAGAVAGREAAQLLARAVRDPELAPCSYAMSHSLFDALRIAGVHDLVDWQPWQDMLDLNLTTWAEDTVSNRSDCHAWGSVPLQHFPRWVLGVAPASAGFGSATVQPSPSGLDFAEGSVPTPHGPIGVRWDQRTPGVLDVVVKAPEVIELLAPPGSAGVIRFVDGGQQTLQFEYRAQDSKAAPHLDLPSGSRSGG